MAESDAGQNELFAHLKALQRMTDAIESATRGVQPGRSRHALESLDLRDCSLGPAGIAAILHGLSRRRNGDPPRRDVGDILVAETDAPEAKVEIKALVVVGDDGGRVVTCGGRLEGASYLPPFGGRALLAAGARFSGDASDCCVAAIGEDSRGADGAATHVLRCFAVGARGFEGLFSELLLEDALGAPLSLIHI